jgi:hypothetical protein
MLVLRDPKAKTFGVLMEAGNGLSFLCKHLGLCRRGLAEHAVLGRPCLEKEPLNLGP